MPNYEKDEQYIEIINPIMRHEQFSQMGSIQHHADTRLNHSLKVSYYSYKIAKTLKLDYIDVARGGLLHDFYLGQVNDQETIKEKFLLYTTKHPDQALDNASKYFQLTAKEVDIIRSHMFPVDIKVPKYAESWIVSVVDKVISTKEFGHKFSGQLTYATNFLYLLFVVRFMR